MQRGTSFAFGLLFAAAVVVVVLQARMPPASRDPGRTGAEPALQPASSATEPTSSGPEADAALGAEAADAATAATDGELLDLPPGAPKSVGFGVVLVTFAGVQFAPERPRTKQQAKELAEQLLELAKQDFPAAVKKGDRGSTTDAGHIPRGVLEPVVEHALFSLEKGAVHDKPLDTPRGFWIVRRND
jgi:hypothetical protein